MPVSPRRSAIAMVGAAAVLLTLVYAAVLGQTSSPVWFLLVICLPPIATSFVGLTIQGNTGRWLVRAAGIYLIPWFYLGIMTAGLALGLIAGFYFASSDRERWTPVHARTKRVPGQPRQFVIWTKQRELPLRHPTN